MARDAKIALPWADGDYTFRLGWGELEELQEKCDAGPYVVLNRLQSESWRIEDISESIRLGLIGGGVAPTEALKLVRRYVLNRPPAENLIFAQAILSAGVIGAPEEQLGETDAPDQAETGLTTFPTES